LLRFAPADRAAGAAPGEIHEEIDARSRAALEQVLREADAEAER